MSNFDTRDPRNWDEGDPTSPLLIPCTACGLLFQVEDLEDLPDICLACETPLTRPAGEDTEWLDA